MKFDLTIRNGSVVTSDAVTEADVGIRHGRIKELSPSISGEARQTIDASGKLVFPGFIDAHTHMGIPIMNTHSADDFESGSIAAAFGGVTTIVDFTVQEPGQTLRQSVDVRIGKARKCHVDYGLHVNVTDEPDQRLHEIPGLISQGFRNFKVFSTYREARLMIGWQEFQSVLKQVDQHGGLLFLHAEDNEIVESQTEHNLSLGQFAPPFHASSRPSEAEASAIERAAGIALALDASLYIVHLSSRQGLERALAARDRGAKLFLETCPQYLLLTEECFERENGHRWITTPALRSKQDTDALWQALAEGLIDVVATDHCPFTVQQKERGDGHFHLTPNGLPGVETLFPLLFTHGVQQGRITIEQLVTVLARNPARICGLAPRKGTIETGADADFVIWDPNAEESIRSSQLHGKADWSPYEGMPISGKLDYTILRGQVLVRGDSFSGQDVRGELLTSHSN